MTDENTQKQPLSMTRRYRRGLILTGVLCVLAMLTAATLLFQRSYVERVDSYIAQICDGYAAAYKARDTHDAMSFAAMLPGGERPHPAFYADQCGRHRAF